MRPRPQRRDRHLRELRPHLQPHASHARLRPASHRRRAGAPPSSRPSSPARGNHPPCRQRPGTRHGTGLLDPLRPRRHRHRHRVRGACRARGAAGERPAGRRVRARAPAGVRDGRGHRVVRDLAARRPRAGSSSSASPSPLSRAATWITARAFVLLVSSLVTRAHRRRAAGRTGTCTSSASRSRRRSSAATCSSHQRYPIRQIGFIPVGVSLAMLLYASSLPSEIEPLVPALQNAAAAHDPRGHGGARRTGSSRRRSRPASGTSSRGRATGSRWLPSHKTLDEVAYRAVIIGFPIFATMIILGSWWASIAWSRYWGWDPKETAGARDLADLRGLPPRAQPAPLGGPARPRCCW